MGIIGYGNSGQAVARYCESQGLSYLVTDDQAVDNGKYVNPDEINVQSAGTWAISPGVPPRNALVQNLLAHEASITTDIGIFLQNHSGRVVSVTGTNGKTSVVEMIVHMLLQSGLEAKAVGNIGASPLDEGSIGCAVMELSSFQLFYTPSVVSDVAVITNVDEDHLDWHATVDEYAASKWKIADHADVIFVGPGTAVPQEYQSKTHEIEAPNDEAMSNLAGQWPHYQLQNAKLAYAAVRQIVGAPNCAPLAELIRGYEIGAHRMQFVADKAGMRWVNDSKGTNIHAVRAALSAQDSPVVLLLGGVYKGGDFSSISSSVSTLRIAICYGRDAEIVAKQLADNNIPHATVATMYDALEEAKRLGHDGDTVLLSPGCASFDEFSSYADRGAQFEKWVGAQ